MFLLPQQQTVKANNGFTSRQVLPTQVGTLIPFLTPPAIPHRILNHWRESRPSPRKVASLISSNFCVQESWTPPWDRTQTAALLSAISRTMLKEQTHSPIFTCRIGPSTFSPSALLLSTRRIRTQFRHAFSLSQVAHPSGGLPMVWKACRTLLKSIQSP